MEKRERLEKTIAGEATDRAPVALSRHFPGDDLRAMDFARAMVDFQRAFDWDFVVLQPASTYLVSDYGLQERWDGSADGTRIVTAHTVQRSLDWTELRALDTNKRGALLRQTEATRLICEAITDTPIILSVYSPLDQAEMLAGRETLIRHLRTHPDRLRSGLNMLTDNTLYFLEALRKLPLAGICLVTRFASYALLSEEEYRVFGLPYDRAILNSVPTGRWWFNILRLEGDLPMFRLVSNLPAQVIQWPDRDTEPDLALGKSQSIGAVCGGLSSQHDLYLSEPSRIATTARESLQRVNNRRMILSTGSPLMLATPQSHIRAVRVAVETTGGAA
jgi:uroporphyrinogen decarboxylase